MTRLWIKICGVTSVRDAEMVADAGADAIGLNFVPSSPRVVTIERARQIANLLRGSIEVVGVFADWKAADLLRVREEVGLDWIQLHGSESKEALLEAGPGAMKAVRIGTQADVDVARTYGGERLLVDALVRGVLGGTGHAFDWSLVEGLASERKLILAGGLGPGNVGSAVRRVRPFGIDTASGVEDSPGQKSAHATRAFVESARAAQAALQDSG